MTQMPELVALMHSMVGLAAMPGRFCDLCRPGGDRGLPQGAAKKSIHELEIYIGIFIGAVTFCWLRDCVLASCPASIGGKPGDCCRGATG